MSDEPILDIDKLAVVEVSAERLGATGCDERDQRIAALEAELAEANERCAELAAALEARGPCKNCDGKGTVWYRKEYADGSFGGALHKLCRCGGIDPSAILAAVREEARREGAVEEEVRLRRKVETLTYKEACMSSDIFCRSLSDRDGRMRREGALEALKRFRTWERVIYGAGSCHAEIRTEIDERIAALEAKG